VSRTQVQSPASKIDVHAAARHGSHQLARSTNGVERPKHPEWRVSELRRKLLLYAYSPRISGCYDHTIEVANDVSVRPHASGQNSSHKFPPQRLGSKNVYKTTKLHIFLDPNHFSRVSADQATCAFSPVTTVENYLRRRPPQLGYILVHQPEKHCDRFRQARWRG
jgi:hypothetical protein